MSIKRRTVNTALRMDGATQMQIRRVIGLLDRVPEDGTTSDASPVGKRRMETTRAVPVASSEQFDMIRTYTERGMREMEKRRFLGKCENFAISAGWVAACAYCEYPGICGFDQKIQGS